MTKIESLVGAGDIRGQEVFLFTDNSTFESIYYQGYFTSWKLSGIVLSIDQAIRDEALIINVVHVAGTCMEAWG